MQVQIVKSDYSDVNNIRDIPEGFFLGNEVTPLFIAGREGQLKRVDKQIVGNNKGAVVGLWQLGELGYLNKSGTINPMKFKFHEKIYATDPSRVPEKYRDVYERLLWSLKSL